jgi:hypothetical protein
MIRRLATFAAFAAGLAWSGNALAAWKTVAVGDLSLRYDDSIWSQQSAAPPSLLRLRCIAGACSHDNVVTFVRDDRPLIAPGFGAFGPGAVTGATVDLRIQSLTPGSRVLARHPAQPVDAGGSTGYRGVYDIQDRALARTGAVIMLMRLPTASVEIRMGASRLSSDDIAAFDRLMSGLTLQN